MAPVSFEPSFSVSFTVLIASARMLPAIVWLLAVTSAWPPLLPALPQLSAEASRNVPEVASSFTPESVMIPVLFVTLKSGPTEVDSEPPVIVNTPRAPSASPDMLW